MNKKHSFFIILFFILISCNKKYDSNFMAFDNINFITEFPSTYELNNYHHYEPNVIGIKNFIIQDSLMIVATSNKRKLLSFISLKNNKEIASAISRGRGPNELLVFPSVNYNTTFYKKENNLFAYIFDSTAGKLVRLNVSDIFKNENYSLEIIKDSLSNSIFNLIAINDSIIYYRQINDEITKQNRFVYNINNNITSSKFDDLNYAHIKFNEDINILSTNIKHSLNNNLIIEMPIGLNYINMYSFDEKIKKTICIGSKMYNINKIQNTSKFNRIYTFSDLRLFDDFWGVLFLDETELAYQTIRTKTPSILLFNWIGEPLAKIKPNKHVTSFDINFLTNELITFDVVTEVFYKYQIGEVIVDIKHK